MIITLDASAAVELVMGRPREKAVAVLLEKADLVLAPQLLTMDLRLAERARKTGISVASLE